MAIIRERLTKREIDALEALLTMVFSNAPIFEINLFNTLSGKSLEESRKNLFDWPNAELHDSNASKELSSILSHLLNFPHRKQKRIFVETGLSTADLRQIRLALRPIQMLAKTSWLAIDGDKQ